MVWGSLRLVPIKFTLHEFKVQYAMPATDMLERFVVRECVGLPHCNLEGSSAPYKVSLLYIADQKLYTLRIYTCFKCTVRSKQTCVLKAYGTPYATKVPCKISIATNWSIQRGAIFWSRLTESMSVPPTVYENVLRNVHENVLQTHSPSPALTLTLTVTRSPNH